jgi:hypothetical protein
VQHFTIVKDPESYTLVERSKAVSDVQTRSIFQWKWMAPFAARNIQPDQYCEMSDFNCYFFGVCFGAFDSAFCLSVHAFNSARLFFLSAALSPFGAVLNWAQGSGGLWDWDQPGSNRPAVNNAVVTK